MACPDDDVIARQLRGALDPREAAAVDAHVVDCSACRELMVELAHVVSSLASGEREPTSARTLAVGDRVGRYTIVGTIGRGAMGVVHRAEDRELQRAVAIKIVSPRATDDVAAGRARLLREAQAMARLQHPNVVRVFDVGTVGTDVFLAMELVEGGTLAQWLARRPRTRAEVLATFDGIANGLAAAHEAGVVHRDVKPDNVLVRHDDHPLVADFGLARGALGEAPSSLPDSTQRGTGSPAAALQLTASDAIVGTPRYMAPEQLVPGGRVDARSDQFAFCVMLFEALYGAHPFPATKLAELCEAVQQGRPAIPDGASVPASLRRVVLRGLAVDPNARWSSMRALAEALRPRSRRAMAWAAALGLVVLASAVAWAGGDAPASLCDDPRAATPPPVGDERIDARVRAWSSAWVQSVQATCVAPAKPEHDVVRQCLLRRRAEVVALLEHASGAQVIDAFASLPAPQDCERITDAPAVPQELATSVAEIRGEIDRVRARLLVGGAEPVLAEAAAVRERAVRLGWDPLHAEALLLFADAAIAAGDDAEAEAALRRAVELAEHAAADALAVEALVDLADVVGTRGSRFGEGEEAIRHAQSILDRGDGDAAAQVRLRTVEGRMRLEQQDFAASKECATRALADGAALAADHPLLLEARAQLAMAQMQLGEHEASEQQLREVLAGQERVYGEAHPRVAETLTRMAIVLRRMHREREALEVLARALAVNEAVHDPMHPNVGMVLANLGLVHLQLEEHDAALAELERALAIYRAAEGDYGPRVATIEFSIGETLSELYGPDDARTIATAHAIGAMHLDRGEFAIAEAQLRECVAACARAGLAGEQLKPDLLSNLANALLEQGELREAEATIRESIALAKATGQEGTLLWANKQHGLGMVLLRLGDREGAEAALEIAVELRTALGDANLPQSKALLEQARG